MAIRALLARRPQTYLVCRSIVLLNSIRDCSICSRVQTAFTHSQCDVLIQVQLCSIAQVHPRIVVYYDRFILSSIE